MSAKQLSGERSRWACTQCRQRKVKCDSQVPACSPCAHKGLNCEYSHTRLRAPTKRKSRREIVRNLEQVEQAVQELVSATSDASQAEDVRQLALAHLQFTGLDEKTYAVDPDVLWQLYLQDAFPKSVGPPGRELTKYKPQSCSALFTINHMRCMDYMVGSLAFSTLCREVLPRHLPVMSLSGGPMQPLPPHETAVKCLRTFLRFFNDDFRFFQDHEITTVFQEYIGGASCPSQAAYAAINMVCACSTWIANGVQPEISERFVENAMRVLPGTLMEEPNRIAVGTLLLMVTYLVATSRSSTAAMVLGSAAQMMLLSGYHEKLSGAGSQSVDDVQEARLLYRGYFLEQDLSLRLGKPSLLTESLITSLPNKLPVDSHGVIVLPEGTSINYLREEVVLAKTQNKVYEKLRAPQCSVRNGLEYLQDTCGLLDELRRWSEALPPSVRPPNVPAGLAARQVMHIKTLHYTYYQTTIAIHSAMFAFSPLFAEPAVRARVYTAVGGCAAAAREMLGLPMHLDTSHPFMPYLLHRVGWNIDGLLLNICVNRRTPEARQDLELLEGVVSAFERGAPQHDGKVAHNAVTIIYKTALEALTYPEAGNPPPV